MSKSDNEHSAGNPALNPALTNASQSKPTITDQSTSDVPVELTSDLNSLSDEEKDHRRRALRSMLTANEARQSQIKLSRPPAMTAGARVAIKSGPHRNKTGVILDADFIHSRALIDCTDEDDAHWIEFAHITSDNEPE